MAGRWVNIPLVGKVSKNVDDASIVKGMGTVENGFVTEQGNHSRFARLRHFAALTDPGRVYLHEWRGDLVAATSYGRFYRVDRNATVSDRTRTPVAGGCRTIFAKTEDELVMAAGSDLVRFAGDRTELLDVSGNAPQSTHVAVLDSYVMAIEKGSGRFHVSLVGEARQWNSLDLFATNGSPDNATSLLVTPFREAIIGGPESTEQFERLSGSDTPFFRRWSNGIGIFAPYMTTFADNALYVIDDKKQLVRLQGQSPMSVGDDVGKVLQGIADWNDAWIGGYPDKALHIQGQHFLMMQWPNALNEYGTKGITFLFDIRLKRFYPLYGWDAVAGLPARYPAWSHWSIWGRHFIGGEGVIYELVE